MANAAIDPPETAEPPAGADTDELLSQLAGSEIDRLLAEADAKPAGSTAPSESTEQKGVNAELDHLFDDLEKPAAAAGESPAAKTETLPEGAERAAVLGAAGFDAPAADSPPAGAERTSLLQAAGFQPGEPEKIAANSLAEGLDDTPADSPPSEAPGAVEPLPAYLKPLAWINAPLNACPANVRMVLGKAAIVTLINALAVLAYVMFFRKR